MQFRLLVRIPGKRWTRFISSELSCAIAAIRKNETGAEKATLISERGLYLMPATTYSPTHFRVQHNRPCGAIFTRDPKLLWLRPFVQADAVPSRSAGSVNRE